MRTRYISQLLSALTLSVGLNGCLTQLAQAAFIQRCPSGTIETGLTFYWQNISGQNICFGTRYCKSVYAYGGYSQFTAQVAGSRCMSQG